MRLITLQFFLTIIIAGCLPFQNMRQQGNYLPKSVPTQLVEKNENDQLYVRKSSIEVKDDLSQSNGSLFPLNDNRGQLFADMPPIQIGDYLDIEMVPMVIDKSDGVTGGNPANGLGGANPNPSTTTPTPGASGGTEEDASYKELIASLPDLGTSNGKYPAVKMVKVKVTAKQNNGDIVVAYHRDSTSEADQSQVNFTAIIPEEKLASQGNFTNKDFIDIEWQEVRGGTTLKRSSTQWQDEYTLRLSSFEEAKSLAALDLQEKRRQLDAVKQRLSEQIKMLSKDKKNFVEQRKKLNDQQEELKRKLEALGSDDSEAKAISESEVGDQKSKKMQKDQKPASDQTDTALSSKDPAASAKKDGKNGQTTSAKNETKSNKS